MKAEQVVRRHSHRHPSRTGEASIGGAAQPPGTDHLISRRQHCDGRRQPAQGLCAITICTRETFFRAARRTARARSAAAPTTTRSRRAYDCPGKWHGMRVGPGSVKITGMWRQVLLAGPLVATVAGTGTPMHRGKPRPADPGKDLAECRAEAHEEAIRQLPYGNGPPFYGAYKEMSMLQWTMAIDNERYYLEEDLIKACMLSKGFALVAGAA